VKCWTLLLPSIQACSTKVECLPVSTGQQRKGFQTMFPLCGRAAKTLRATTGRTAPAHDNIAGGFYGDPAKALVMTHVERFVRDGHAEWIMLNNGDVKLQFFSGEVFLLTDATITRVM
jgi:hypothetical protein